MSFTPIESTQYPGFYHPKGVDLVVVSKDGRVINVRTGRELTTHPNDNGYVTLCVHIPTDPPTFKNFNLHRLLALAFIEIPDNLKHLTGRFLTVNHKDTDKRNNAIDNLEWLTVQDNSIHAVKNGLGPLSKPVLAKNVTTNEIERYVSVQECASYFDIDNQLLRTHLNGEEAGKRYHAGYVFIFEDEEDDVWPAYDRLLPLTAGRAVIGFNVKTNQKLLDSSVKALCENVRINPKAYGNHVKAKGVDVPYHDWLIYDNVDLTKPEDLLLFNEWNRRPKELHHTVVSYGVRDVVTGHTQILDGTKAVSEAVGYSVQSIGEALRLKQGFIGNYHITKLDRHRSLNAE